MGDYRAIRQELELFNPALATKPQASNQGSSRRERHQGSVQAACLQPCLRCRWPNNQLT